MTAAWQLHKPQQSMLILTLTCTKTSGIMGQDAWHPAKAESMMETHLCLIHYRDTSHMRIDVNSTACLFIRHAAWQLTIRMAIADDSQATCHWSPTAWQQTPECRFLKCIHSDRCCALNAAFRLAISCIKLGGYFEHGHRCLTGRQGTAGDRGCLTGREEGHIQPHLCKQTHE